MHSLFYFYLFLVHIRLAVQNEHMVRWFLNHGIDPNANTYGDRTAISDACRIAPLSIVKLLVEHGANVKDKDVVAQAAIEHNLGVSERLEAINYVLDLGAPIDMYANVASINKPDSLFFSYVATTGLETALQHAVKGGNEDMVKLLLGRGADKNLKAEKCFRDSRRKGIS
jgi:ankyrin repeat protein